MMEKHKTAFTYISQAFATYGITVTIFLLFSLLIGEGTGAYSPLFRLGRAGLTLGTLGQLLLLSAVITFVQVLFLTDRWIKNMPILLRNVLFFALVFLAIVAMILLFDWFPIDEWKAWVGFVVSFILSMGVSVFITRLKERAENRRMEAALEKYRQNGLLKKD